MLSAKHIYNMSCKTDPLIENCNHTYINIKNGKEDWVRELIRLLEIKSVTPSNSEEWSSIVSTFANLDKNPEMVICEVELSIDTIHSLYMPHITI